MNATVLDATGDKDVMEMPPASTLAPVPSPEPIRPKRMSPAMKWDAMDVQGRLDVLHEMEQRGMLPPGTLVRDYFAAWEAIDMRFGNLLYDIQDKVESYFRKNFEDKD
jgi:hypothetical protein